VVGTFPALNLNQAASAFQFLTRFSSSLLFAAAAALFFFAQYGLSGVYIGSKFTTVEYFPCPLILWSRNKASRHPGVRWRWSLDYFCRRPPFSCAVDSHGPLSVAYSNISYGCLVKQFKSKSAPTKKSSSRAQFQCEVIRFVAVLFFFCLQYICMRCCPVARHSFVPLHLCFS
jgi:hypothetical protein